MNETPSAENGEPLTQEEMAEGHLFEFTWQSWGVSRVVGDPTYTQTDWSLPPHPVRVRAWSLREALAKAADLPLAAWFPDDDGDIPTCTCVSYGPLVHAPDCTWATHVTSPARGDVR